MGKGQTEKGLKRDYYNLRMWRFLNQVRLNAKQNAVSDMLVSKIEKIDNESSNSILLKKHQKELSHKIKNKKHLNLLAS